MTRLKLQLRSQGQHCRLTFASSWLQLVARYYADLARHLIGLAISFVDLDHRSLGLTNDRCFVDLRIPQPCFLLSYTPCLEGRTNLMVAQFLKSHCESDCYHYHWKVATLWSRLLSHNQLLSRLEVLEALSIVIATRWPKASTTTTITIIFEPSFDSSSFLVPGSISEQDGLRVCGSTLRWQSSPPT